MIITLHPPFSLNTSWSGLSCLLVALRGCLKQPGPPPGVVLPVEDDLVIQEPRALPRNNLFPECLVLEQLQEVQADGVLQVVNICRLLPVHQVPQVVDKTLILHEASLSKEVEIIWIGKTLYKLHLHLKPQLSLLVRLSHVSHAGHGA